MREGRCSSLRRKDCLRTPVCQPSLLQCPLLTRSTNLPRGSKGLPNSPLDSLTRGGLYSRGGLGANRARMSAAREIDGGRFGEAGVKVLTQWACSLHLFTDVLQPCEELCILALPALPPDTLTRWHESNGRPCQTLGLPSPVEIPSSTAASEASSAPSEATCRE